MTLLSYNKAQLKKPFPLLPRFKMDSLDELKGFEAQLNPETNPDTCEEVIAQFLIEFLRNSNYTIIL